MCGGQDGRKTFRDPAIKIIKQYYSYILFLIDNGMFLGTAEKKLICLCTMVKNGYSRRHNSAETFIFPTAMGVSEVSNRNSMMRKNPPFT